MTDLADRTLVQGQPVLNEAEIHQQLTALPDWSLTTQSDVPRIQRAYRFADFAKPWPSSTRLAHWPRSRTTTRPCC
ncbi:4a-hydroxytetrahydrobiopterin dehydratase [Halopseudomonas pachastrellae]|nr:4a-hydroxytetrahydrobiopterin dehydratase [Halopseudomonas pachastrellae]